MFGVVRARFSGIVAIQHGVVGTITIRICFEGVAAESGRPGFNYLGGRLSGVLEPDLL